MENKYDFTKDRREKPETEYKLTSLGQLKEPFRGLKSRLNEALRDPFTGQTPMGMK